MTCLAFLCSLLGNVFSLPFFSFSFLYNSHLSSFLQVLCLFPLHFHFFKKIILLPFLCTAIDLYFSFTAQLTSFISFLTLLSTLLVMYSKIPLYFPLFSVSFSSPSPFLLFFFMLSCCSPLSSLFLFFSPVSSTVFCSSLLWT